MMQTLFLAAVLLSGPGAPPPSAPPVREAKVYDPYKAKSYADLKQYAQAGLRPVLVVGVVDPFVGTYQIHWREPSGTLPLPTGGVVVDGIYHCVWTRTGTIELHPFTVPQKMAPVEAVAGVGATSPPPTSTATTTSLFGGAYTRTQTCNGPNCPQAQTVRRGLFR